MFRWTNRIGRVPGSLLVISVVALLAAACGGDDPTPTSVPPTATPVPQATSTPTPAPAGTTPSAPRPTPTPRPAATPTPTPEPLSFDGKVVRFNVGFSPGGSFDLGARFMAKHIADRLPGNPRVVVSSLPGAGSLTAARKILTTEPRESQPEVVIFIASILLRSVLGGVEGFDPAQAAFLGVPDLGARNTSMCSRTEVVDSLDAFLGAGKEFTVAGLDGTSSTDIDLKWADLVGLPVKPVFGYGGMTEFRAAIDRGELELASPCTDTDIAQFPHWETDNYLTPLFGFTDTAPDWIQRGLDQGKWPWFGNILNIPLVQANASQAQIDAINFFHDLTSFSSGGQVYAMHKDTDPRILAAMRSAFAEVVESPEFGADLKRQGFEAGLMDGDTLQGLMGGAGQLSPDTIGVLKGLFGIR